MQHIHESSCKGGIQKIGAKIIPTKAVVRENMELREQQDILDLICKRW